MVHITHNFQIIYYLLLRLFIGTFSSQSWTSQACFQMILGVTWSYTLLLAFEFFLLELSADKSGLLSDDIRGYLVLHFTKLFHKAVQGYDPR